jgi:hypothetical protein
MNYVNLVKRIRACESEVTAQLVLEKWIDQFQYTVGVDIGKQQDQCHVVVVCKHFEGSPAFIVYSQDLTAQTKPKTFMATYEHQAYGYWTDESGQTHLGVIPKEKRK